MNILVTGGAGFIGSTVVDEYIRLGHQVWVIDNLSSGTRTQVNKQAHFTKVDVRDHAAVRRFFKGKRFDLVNHLAAQIDVRKSVENPVFDAEVNILGTINLLNLCRDHGVRKFLFSSSGGTVYGECLHPAPEGNPEIPVSPYGVAKLACEKYIQSYGALYGLKYTIFRYANVYGPRQDPHGEAGVVAIFSNRLLKRESSIIFGSGTQTRDFVFVGDVARANGLALHKAHNEIINIGTGMETSVNRLYSIMAALAGDRRPVKKKPGRAGELKRSVLKIDKARHILGWRPEVSITEGLRRTLQYFSQHLG